MTTAQEELRRRLGALGFDEVRFARTADLPPTGLRSWLENGQHADMAWMERTAEKRLDPGLVLPGARSVIMLGVNYSSDRWLPVSERRRVAPAEPSESAARGSAAISAGEPGRPIWARYALHEDYHDTIKPALVAAGREIERLFGVTAGDYRYYVDTGPILERGWAAQAGLGFIGKNAMLISRRHGNWLFLAAILTRVELTADEPIRKKFRDHASGKESGVGLLCGKCTRCLDACPTNAFPRAGVVDARRCISYQTIENRGIIPRELRAAIGFHLYGCDICLEVCPWNRFARAGRQLLLAARGDIAALSLREILELTPARFAEVFRRTAIKRLKLVGLLRNACVVAGNSGDRELLEPLIRLARHASPIVRAHAVWATRRLGEDARIAAVRAAEMDPVVLAEYAAKVEPVDSNALGVSARI